MDGGPISLWGRVMACPITSRFLQGTSSGGKGRMDCPNPMWFILLFAVHLWHRHLCGCAEWEVKGAGLRNVAKACADLHEKGRVAWLRRGRGRGRLGPSSRAPTAPCPLLLQYLPSPRLLHGGRRSPNRGSSARGCAPISMTKRVFTWPRPRRARLCPGSDDRAAAPLRAPPTPTPSGPSDLSKIERAELGRGH